ncbi:MAG: calcium-binding protein [Pleurocapsa sp.]
MNGGGGDDILDGGVEDDILDGGSGNDTLSGDDGFDVFVLGADNGSDTIIDFEPGQDSFSLSGSISFSDLTLAGNQIEIGDTLIATVEGVDTSSLSAPDFNQPANPEESSNEGTLDADTINGTDSAERIKGFAGDDVINALGGFDLVFGDVGNDRLDGGKGSDTIYGGRGNDTINGGVGSGNDILVGQEGNDFFVIADNVGADIITDFNPEQDGFELSGDLSFGDLTLSGNQIFIGSLLVATVEGIEDLNSLPPSSFKEDEPTNPGEPNLIEGTLDSDTINGTDSADRIKGFAGNDVINAFGSDDTVFGDVGDDELDGGSGNDTVVGGVGSDTMIGGAGNDVLVGEEGNDFFVLTPNQGTDTITDFNIESDRFILSGNLIFEELNFNNNSILAGDETIATIEGVDTTELQADNFV